MSETPVHADKCPFCGKVFVNPPEPSYVTDGSGKWGAIECGMCGARGPDVRTGYKLFAEWRDEAVKAWNRRAP